MEIRETRADELAEVLRVEREAFGQEEEAELVVGLLADPSAEPRLSLVAIDGERTVGHVLFTRATLEAEGPESDLELSILAPLAVAPEAQGKGVGGRLVEHGHGLLRQRGVDLVFVLGHPGYYPRFGFEPALPHGLEATYPILDAQSDAWMVLALRQGALEGVGGRVICADALNHPEMWLE